LKVKRFLLLAVMVQFVSIAEAILDRYESLANWNNLPKMKRDVTPGIVSSYDRLGGNNDYNSYLWPTGFQTTDVNTVVTKLIGPGIITRFWMPQFNSRDVTSVINLHPVPCKVSPDW
jgi:hypothetical protein